MATVVYICHMNDSFLYFGLGMLVKGASQVVLVVKNLPANVGNIRDAGSIPGSERSPGGGHSNPL